MTQLETPRSTFIRPIPRKRKLVIKTSTGTMAFVLSFIVSLVGLMNAILGPIAAAVIFGIGFMSFIAFPNMLISNPRSKWVVGIASLSFISLLWSAHPGVTAYYSTQLFLTIMVGLTLASFQNPTPVLKGLFYAHLFFAIISLIFGQHVLWEDGQYIFVGLSKAKNNYGAMNFYVALLGVYAIHQGLRERRAVFAGLGLLSVLVGFVGIGYAKASGSFVTTVLGILLYLALVGLTRLRANNRLTLLLVGTILVGMMALLLSTIWEELMRGVLDYFGKDPTLTGRIDLWDIADRIIEQNYWLGVGHFAFWVQGDALPEAIWAQMNILSRSGFNFHNTYRELMIHFGIIGVILYGGIVALLAGKLLKAALFRPRLETIVLTVMTVSTFTKLPFEAVLPLAPMSPGTIFLITALGLRPGTRPT
jgi:exopolysaccharide production protein ExoQ